MGSQAQVTDWTRSQSCSIIRQGVQPHWSAAMCELKPQWKHQCGKNDSNRSQYCRRLRAVGVCLTSLLGAYWHDCLESWERKPLSGDLPRLWCSRPRKQTQRCSHKHVTECWMHASWDSHMLATLCPSEKLSGPQLHRSAWVEWEKVE